MDLNNLTFDDFDSVISNITLEQFIDIQVRYGKYPNPKFSEELHMIYGILPIFSKGENIIVTKTLSQHLDILKDITDYDIYVKWGGELMILLRTDTDKKTFISYTMRHEFPNLWVYGLAFRMQDSL